MNRSTTPLQALGAFLALPVVVAGALPASLMVLGGPRVAGHALAGSLLVLGGFLPIAAAAVSFYRRGRGTLAPWDPPRHLVVEGLYRFNRNPMYVGVVTAIAGWAVATGTLSIAILAIIAGIVFHLRVVLYEEPEMKRLFGSEWERYRKAVPRWGIAARPFDPDEPISG